MFQESTAKGDLKTSESTKGQANRKRIMGEMINDLPNYDGMNYDNAVLRIAFKFNLAPDTVKYSYIPIFIEMKMMSIDKEYKIHIGNYTPEINPEMEPYLKAKKKLMEEEKPLIDNEKIDEADQSLYQDYVKNCKKDKETPLTYDLWLTRKYEKKKEDK